MAWTSDGYALAVGYEHGWATWSVSGRLCGWGLSLEEAGSADEGFMGGLLDIVSTSKLKTDGSSGYLEMSSSLH